MKQETALKRLEKAAAQKIISKKDKMYYEIGWVIKYGGRINPVWVAGIGRHKHLEDRTQLVEDVLQAMKIKYEILNDAPRGGKLGNFIKITTKIERV